MKVRFASAISQQFDLGWILARRQVTSRYKGSAMGVTWSIVQPIIMLSIYTFVFSTIFKSRWLGQEETGSLGYALNLFAGLALFNVVAEVMGSSTSLITSNKNYVTKIVFPLYILPVSQAFSAMINSIPSISILLIFSGIVNGFISINSLWMMVIMVELLLILLAVSWTISSLSVYLRDLEQLIPPLISILMFMSAIFYPVKSLPDLAQFLVWINPLALLIEQTRIVIVLNQTPNVYILIITGIVALISAELTYRFFQKLSRGFSDVI